MKPFFTSLILIISYFSIFSISSIYAEDYQYQYFQETKRFMPFSDYIPEIRLHYKTVPHYVEDFYLLYGLKLYYYNETVLRNNIEKLKIALNCKFRHPSEALVKTDSDEEYLKYRKLIAMNINLLIMRCYMKIASTYDLPKVSFHSGAFADEIKDSFKNADFFYNEAKPYWFEAKRLAEEASKIKITTDLGYEESTRFSIVKKQLNYERIINSHIAKLKTKSNQLDKLVAKYPNN
jgi:hypothetical protein